MSNDEQDKQQVADDVLVGRFQSGPQSASGKQAVAQLLQRYQRAVYLWCFRYVREHDDALDLAQDVFLKAYEALPSFRSQSEFSSWLFAIARNRCLKELRRGNAFVELDAVEGVLADTAATPDQAFDDSESETRLLELVERTLDPLEQRAIWMRCVERVPVDEITARLELDSTSGARGLLQAARRKLRSALAQSPKRTEGEHS